jgi:hypothetical protein
MSLRTLLGRLMLRFRTSGKDMLPTRIAPRKACIANEGVPVGSVANLCFQIGKIMVQVTVAEAKLRHLCAGTWNVTAS